MENKKYQDVMSRLSVTPEMAERILEGIKDAEEITGTEEIRDTAGITETADREDRRGDTNTGDITEIRDKDGRDGIRKTDDNVVSLKQAYSSSKKKRTPRRYRRFTSVAAALALLLAGSLIGLSLAGPGSGSQSASGLKSYSEESDADYPAETESYDYNGVRTDEDYDVEEAQGQAETAGYGMSDSSALSEESASEKSSSGKGENKTNQNAADGQKLVYTASLHVETEEYQKSLEALKRAIRESGGYVEAENETSYSNSPYEYEIQESGRDKLMRNELTMRIPVTGYDSFLEKMTKIGSVVSKSQNVDNVTGYYQDTEVQIKALKIQEKRLLEMMEKAETIEDMIAVERRLTEVQSELDSYERTLKGLDDQVDYATINLSLQEVKKYTESPEASFGQKAKSRLEEGIENFTEGVVSLILGLLYLLPVIIFIMVLVIIIRYIMKKRGWKLNFGEKNTEEMDPDVFRDDNPDLFR